jgi:hypothetical protein
MVGEITPGGLPALGLVEVTTTSYGGHPPEFWASLIQELNQGDAKDLANIIKGI